MQRLLESFPRNASRHTSSVCSQRRGRIMTAHHARTYTYRARDYRVSTGTRSWVLLVPVLASAFGVWLSFKTPLQTEAAKFNDRNDLPKVSGAQLASHNSVDSCWVAIDGKVYDVTDFLSQHPGGSEIVLQNAGKDISTIFRLLHPIDVLAQSLRPANIVGVVDVAFPPSLAEMEEDESFVLERRWSLPPVESVPNLKTFENLAKFVLGEDSQAWTYIQSWSDDGYTYEATRNAFRWIRFVPRVNVPVSKIDTSASILDGTEISLPIFISPTGQNRGAHPDGELNSLRACYYTNVPQCLSNASSMSLEEVLATREQLANVTTSKPAIMLWQLYLRTDRSKNVSQIRTAAAGGVNAIVVTVDVPALGNRETDVTHSQRLAKLSGKDNTEVRERRLKPLAKIALEDLTWADIGWIKKLAPSVPVLVKGILSIEDVALAKQAGADGVILSNHGGRQLDFAPPPLAVLARLRMERPDLLKAFDVYIDGGVTRGTDVLKALCLGAKAVGLGRAALHAQACYGTEGVVRMLQILSDEITTGMRLLGATRISDLKPEMVEIMPGLLGEIQSTKPAGQSA